uniref:C2H2-type domain-containing protein n=1 Tax=Hippocampus comes TaxID=109280 RepID=A0A3Q2XQH1_HIPCM
MCKVRILRTLVTQRLNVAVEEIFELFERTIAEYEEELCRSKEEKERQRQLLDAVLNPQVRLHRADIQQVLVKSQEKVAGVVEQVEPVEPTHIKDEEREAWSSGDGEQLHRREEEANVAHFTWAGGVHVKSEEDKDQSSQLQCSQSDGNREAAANTHSLENNFTPPSDTPDMMLPLSDTYRSDDAEGPSDSKSTKNRFICPECGRTFAYKKTLKTHMIIHTGEKDFACSFCAKRFYRKCDMKNHLATHTSEKPFNCVICAKGFTLRKYMMIHMKTHAAALHARPQVTTQGDGNCLSRSERGKTFVDKATLNRRATTHGGEKSFACSRCLKSFSRGDDLKLHMSIHFRRKTFSCHVCNKRFTYQKNVMIHMRTHTGEKAFGCDACRQTFCYKYQLDKHRCFVMDAAATSTDSEMMDKQFDELMWE